MILFWTMVDHFQCHLFFRCCHNDLTAIVKWFDSYFRKRHAPCPCLFWPAEPERRVHEMRYKRPSSGWLLTLGHEVPKIKVYNGKFRRHFLELSDWWNLCRPTTLAHVQQGPTAISTWRRRWKKARKRRHFMCLGFAIRWLSRFKWSMLMTMFV